MLLPHAGESLHGAAENRATSSINVIVTIGIDIGRGSDPRLCRVRRRSWSPSRRLSNSTFKGCTGYVNGRFADGLAMQCMSPLMVPEADIRENDAGEKKDRLAQAV